jgi:hypothetical protein
MPGETASFGAMLVNSTNGSRRDVSQQARWTSSNPGVLTVRFGSAFAQMPGQAVLGASFAGQMDARAVTIGSIESRSNLFVCRLAEHSTSSRRTRVSTGWVIAEWESAAGLQLRRFD